MIRLEIFLVTLLIFYIENSFGKAIDPNEIFKSKVCADDIKKLCPEDMQDSDLKILTCLQDSESVMRQISFKCQHYLWDYKHKLTTSTLFDQITKEKCEEELSANKECNAATVGLKAPCLLDHKDKITSKQCSTFLNGMGVVIFSDYHLIYKFVDKCKADIGKFKCGRITKPGSKDIAPKEDNDENPINEEGVTFADYVTSQSHTLDCLIDSIQEIDVECQTQILRLSELQSNDYHLNRGLYLACREDRETLCAKVKSGEGRVYSCLMKQKSSVKMSEKCREELTRKQQVESLDAKADYPLFQECEIDIKINHCFKDTSDIRHEIVFMSVILMCLHDAEMDGKKLQPNCKKELIERHAEMLEDYKISPNVLKWCKNDVRDNCKQHEDEPGEVIHCLMKLATPDLKHKEGKLSSDCKSSILQMLKEANPTENILTEDVAIREACSSSYLELCSDISTDKEAFQCLVNKIDSPKMASKCRDKITSLLYFISLDITIDDHLNRACHSDARRLCNAPQKMLEENSIQKQLEYHCMYENFKKDKISLDLAQAKGLPPSQYNLSLSAECSQEIFNLIRAQSSKIELDPTLILPCFEDLGRFCADANGKGKEHECLQRNVKSLEPRCRKAVIEFSQLEDVDSRLNRMLSDACVPMVHKFCSGEKPDNIIICLTEHKTHPEMSEPCHAAIEHVQIMSLEEYHIDHRFASFCGPEIEKYCQEELSQDSSTKEGGDKNNKVVSKATIVSCLSKRIVKELLNGEKHPLSDICRRQFTFELLQRSETIDLDPSLLTDCSLDIKRFCKEVKSKHINSCLREHQDKLTGSCHKRLFRRERLEALDANFDGELQEKCGQMIHERCHNVPGNKVFRCLHRLMKENGFDKGCKKLILSRLERRMNDIRLNPGLINECRKDIKKYCHVDDPNHDEPTSGIEYEGKIILCLKLQHTNDTKSLHRSCAIRIHEIIVEANTNMRLDPTLRSKCKQDMEEFCKKEMTNEFDDAVNSVHNCLKYKYLRDELRSTLCKREVGRLIREGRADVHVDTELYDACENAIVQLCHSESLGDGRKMSCLLSLVEDKKAAMLLDKRCLLMIKDRKELWEKAGKFESQNLQELYQHVTGSSTRGYLLSMLGLMVAGLILLGVCCGRVTKRVAVDLKNK